MAEIGTQNFPRTKRFDMEERKTLVFNAKQRTIGVSGQSGIVSHREKHGFRLSRDVSRTAGCAACCDARAWVGLALTRSERRPLSNERRVECRRGVSRVRSRSPPSQLRGSRRRGQRDFSAQAGGNIGTTFGSKRVKHNRRPHFGWSHATNLSPNLPTHRRRFPIFVVAGGRRRVGQPEGGEGGGGEAGARLQQVRARVAPLRRSDEKERNACTGGTTTTRPVSR